jgi:hypothetical protein
MIFNKFKLKSIIILINYAETIISNMSVISSIYA